MKNLVKKTVATLVVVACSLGGVLSAQAAETGQIREFYACNFLQGKDMDDLMAARDNLVAQIGADYSGTTFLWTPIKTNNELDFLWFNNYENLNAWGAGQAILATERGQAVLQRFLDIADCRSGLVSQQQIFEGGAFQVTNPPATVISYACNLHPGKNLAEVNEAVAHYNQVMTRLGMHRNFNAFMQIPIVSSAGRDVYFYGVFDGLAAFAAGSSVTLTAPEYQPVAAHFAELIRCDTSLWNGQVIVPIPE